MAKRNKSKGEYRDPDWPAGLHRRDGHYHWRRMIDGERRSKTLRTRNLAVAVKKAAELNESVEDRGLTLTQAVAKEKATFARAASEFLERPGVRAATVKRYSAILDNFQRIAAEIQGKPDLLVREVNENLVSTYLARREKEPVSPNGHPNTRKTAKVSSKTLYSERQTVIAVVRFATERGWLQQMPNFSASSFGKKVRKGSSDKARPLDTDELRRMLKAAAEYDAQHAGKFAFPTFFHDALCAYVYLGLRHQELRFLEWTDVDLRRGIVKIRAKRVNTARKVPIPPGAREWMAELLQGKKQSERLLENDAELAWEIATTIKFRQAEPLRSVRVRDFDLDAGVVSISESLEWGPKASEGEVPLHPKLRTIFMKLKKLATSNFVFPDTDGGYWRVRFERHLQRIAVLAEVENFTRTHDLRHTTGAMLRRNGVGLHTIKEILRHQNLEDTLIYAKYELDEGVKAIKKLPSW